MNLRLLCCLAIVACETPDQSITRGADGARDWQRHLETAIPLAISRDSVLAVMRANGFTCSINTDSLPTVYCDKRSSKQIVFRRWQAVITLVGQHRVTAVHGTTGLVGP